MPSRFINHQVSTHSTADQAEHSAASVIPFSGRQLAVTATVSWFALSTNDHYFQGFTFQSASSNAVLPCAHARLRRQVLESPLWRGRPLLPLSTWKIPWFSEKVCRKIGDVSFVELSHLLPGCMTERIFWDVRVRIWRKRFEKDQRTPAGLAEPRHVVRIRQSLRKAMH